METRRYRVAVLASHVVQYQVPVFRALAASEEIDLTVYFCSRWGAEEYADREFGTRVKWDLPGLDGYDHRFLRNWSFLGGTDSFFDVINPGIFGELCRERYDAIVIPGYAMASYWLAYLAAWLSGTPVFFRGETALRPNPRWPRRLIKEPLLRALFARTAAFLTIGSRSREFYRHYGADPKRLFFTPYTVDNVFFMAEADRWAAERPALRRALGLPEACPVILFAGKLVPRKRPLDLLEAYACLESEAALVFVGDGELRGGLEGYCREKGLSRVVFAGFQNQSQMPRFYALADVLVLPSSHEVSPLVLNEAMCSGLALVVSDAVPSAVDLVLEGQTGHTYPCGDISKLAAALGGLIGDRDRLEAMKARSREVIRAWNNEAVVEGVLNALRRFSRPGAHASL